MAWRDRAACKGQPYKLFFRDIDTPTVGRLTPELQRGLDICATCPVIEQCRAEGMRLNATGGLAEKHGTWGGLTESQREWRTPRGQRKREKRLAEAQARREARNADASPTQATLL